MRASTTATHLPLCLVLAACSVDDSGSEHVPGHHEGVEEADEALTDLSAQCTFAGSGLMTLTLHGGDIALIARASDGRILINGFECNGATATTLKRLEVSEGTAGDETLILDYSGGLFALGTSGAVGITVDLAGETAGDALKIIGLTGNDSFVFGSTGLAINADGFRDITATGIEEYVASLGSGNDSFSGAGSAATGAAFAPAVELFGGAGNDTLRGGAGDDLVSGGDGTDLLAAGTAADGADTMNGGGGVDTADYGARTAAVTVSIDGAANDGAAAGGEGDLVAADVETIKGGSAGDILSGGAGSQTVFGGPGDDTLAGGAGDDVMHGEAGDDRFDEGSASSGADVMNGGAGTDTADYSARLATVAVALDGLAGDGEGGESDRVAIDVENVTGGAGDDSLTGSTAANLLVGGGGGDSLLGADGNDLLRGGAGDDVLDGGGGNDTLDAEATASGGDTMIGGAGIDHVTYAGRSGAVVVVMDGSTPGGESGETDTVGADVENLTAGPGDDEVTGNGMDNVLSGGDGTDTLAGSAGDDTIDGDAGDDEIDCGTGDADVLLDSTTASNSGCEL